MKYLYRDKIYWTFNQLQQAKEDYKQELFNDIIKTFDTATREEVQSLFDLLIYKALEHEIVQIEVF